MKMKLGYTEFSFGYAFTENLIRSTANRPAGAPVFPNLVQEGQLGYDVRINFPGCPLYFQYKLPELMVRNNAVEITKYALPGLAVPFFRMALMRNDLSMQDQKLIALENSSPNAVYYAAPCLPSLDEFNDAYNSAKVHRRSVLFSPKKIGPLLDDKQHVIAYSSDLDTAWLRSRPRDVAAMRWKDIEIHVRQSFEKRRYPTLESTVNSIRKEMLPLVPRRIRSVEGVIRRRVQMRSKVLPEGTGRVDADTQDLVEQILVYREIARVGLGLDVIVAQSPAGWEGTNEFTE